MMKFLTSAAVALGLTFAPMAQAADASRASAPVSNASFLAGDGNDSATPLIMALVIAVATIYLLVEGGDDDNPDSP